MIDKHLFSITFACHNGLHITKKCIQSLKESKTPFDRIVVVDNASTDGTVSYFKKVPKINLIENKDNLWCGVAWNQGILFYQSEWTVIMNNDILVSDHWIEKLINIAKKNHMQILAPSLVEGSLDYDFNKFSKKASEKMKDVLRIQKPHLICAVIHKSVFEKIGYFRATPKLTGYEDQIFFNLAQDAGIRMGITGAVWIHHFYQITQRIFIKEQKLPERTNIGVRDNFKQLNQSWLKRKLRKINHARLIKRYKDEELSLYQMTIHAHRLNGNFMWK